MSFLFKTVFSNRTSPPTNSSSSLSATNSQILPEESPDPTNLNDKKSSRHFPSLESLRALQNAGVPLSGISEGDCASCTQSCSVPMNMEGYPRTFSIDTTTPLLGTIKPYDYLILCSSGKSDWAHDVCEDVNQVPGALRKAYPKSTPTSTKLLSQDNKISGIFPLPKKQSQSFLQHHQLLIKEQEEEKEEELLSLKKKVTILSSSHISSSKDSKAESLIILPDWILVSDVTPSNIPQLPLTGSHQCTRLPHDIIILLCSHKTRDKRCSIAAPILREAIIDSIESLDSECRVEMRGDETLATNDRLVGIFFVSHSGGHKFAGNMIICFPNGASVWYGRVTPSDCDRIVKETVVGLKVIPELLKGGFGLESLKTHHALEW